MDILKQIATICSEGPLITSLLIIFTTIVLFYLCFSRNINYWEGKGVPFVKTSLFFPSILENLRKPFHVIEIERYKKYGRIYGHFEGNQPLLSVADPEILRNILVKDFPVFSEIRRLIKGDKIRDNMLTGLSGEDWKRVRMTVTPTFTTGKIKKLFDIFKECSNTLVKNFKGAAEKKEPLEVKRMYGAFTMDAIASSAFSTKIDSHNDPNNEFVATARSAFSRNIGLIFVILSLLPRWLSFIRSKFLTTGITFFREVTLQIIEERKKTGQKRNDFLQLLMDAGKEGVEEIKADLTDNDVLENYGKVENDVLKNVVSKKCLSFDEIVAQCILFFLAGYETTATTLSFVTYSLALNPDIQEKVIQELDDILRKNDGDLTYEAIQSMKYLDDVISETLRIFPPATRLQRVANENYKLGDSGLIVPKGMVITIPVCAIHKDPEFFPDPEKFDPYRFSPEERAKRSPFVYFPFGIGPRNCVAMRFALVEIKVCLAYMLRNFRFKKCEKTEIPVEYFSGFGFLSPKAITVQVEARKDAIKPV